MGPLLGLLSLFCAYWFLVVMPVIAAVFAWQDYRIKKLSTALLTVIVMIAVYFASAVLIWTLGTADWKLSFLATLEASVNAEKYGAAIESRAERMVIWLLIYSTLAAALAGAVTPAARYAWTRWRRVRVGGSHRAG